MAKLSLIFPSRDERFLIPSIHDAFRNARGEFEVVAVMDSDKWPEGWKEVCDQYPNLHTIHHGTSKGMRAAINSGVGSAISRGAKYVAKFDAHCSFSEGFDEVLKSECEPNWIVVPRRKRLNPETWELTDTNKPDVDYHYLSFPDDPQDFGGPGLNGKIWTQRAVERKDILLDDEMSSQGSGWFMHAAYFTELELMDETNYGKFWNEFQELGLKCWLSGGQVKINKKCWYSHWHKGKAGRGYRLEESALQQGASFTKNWIWNEAWPKQTLPFKWLIEKFWPVPSWPENWEEVLYATRKPRLVADVGDSTGISSDSNSRLDVSGMSLVIHKAHYGIGSLEDIDVTERLQNLAYLNKDSLDIVVNNSTLTPGQNPFRGKKKQLNITYSFDGSSESVTRTVEEKDWLIIGPAQQEQSKYVTGVTPVELLGSKASAEFIAKRDGEVGESKRLFHEAVTTGKDDEKVEAGRNMVRAAVGMYLDSLGSNQENDIRSGRHNPLEDLSGHGNDMVRVLVDPPRTAAALNDYLIRRFSISPQRLRGPMPIELRDFHRNDLAQLFAELGFKRGAEIGVAEGNYSQILLKANPECELLLVDPWHHYSDNPQGKTKEKHEFALNEVYRKTAGYKVLIYQENSMDAIQQVPDIPLDFVYIDGNHLFDYVMQDLIEWSKKVRSGGIVSGDDYYALDQKRWVGGGVVEAVQAYVNAHRIPVWYIFQGHKSVDFMWVRP